MATIDTLFWRNGIEIERADGAVAKQLYADQTFLVPSLLREGTAFPDLDTPLNSTENMSSRLSKTPLGALLAPR